MLKRYLRRYQNLSIKAAHVIKELINLIIHAHRGEVIGLTEDEVAFYDSLEKNDSAVKALGNDTLRTISWKLVTTVS